MTQQRISTNIAQHLAQLPLDKTISIIAGAGTGKTTNLCARYVALLKQDPHLLPEEIVVLTFTDKAATEMRARILDAVARDAELSTRFTRLDMAAAQISTFHVYAAQLVLRHSIALDIDPSQPIADQEDTIARLDHLWDSFRTTDWERVFDAHTPALTEVNWQSEDTYKKFSDIIADAKGRAESADTFATTLPATAKPVAHIYLRTIESLYRAYHAGLDHDGMLDLDGLIRVAPALVRQDSREQARLRVVMFDEYQDTSAAQDTLMRTMTPASNGSATARFVVGDPRQSIYLWRQAQPENLRRVDAETPASQRFSLLTNHRSKPPILAVANQILTLYQHPNDPAQRAFDPAEELIAAPENTALDQPRPNSRTKQIHEPAGVRLTFFADAASEAHAIAGRISELHAKSVPYGDMAVLVRARRAAVPILAALRAAGIPTDDGALTPFYKLPIVLDAVHTLLAAYDPYNELSLTRTVWQAARVWDEPQLASARIAARGVPLWDILRRTNDEPAVHALVTALTEGFRTRLSTPPMTWAQQVLTATGVWQRDGAYGIRVLQRVLLALCADNTSVHALVAAITHIPHSETKADAPELRTDRNAVRIMTVHAAKGLEFAAVFVPAAHGFSKGRESIPSYKTGTLRFTKEDPADPAYAVAVQNEVITLFYVAVTRAEYWLWVSGVQKANGRAAQRAEELGPTKPFATVCAYYADHPTVGISVVTDPQPQSVHRATRPQTHTSAPLPIPLETKPLVHLTPTTLADLHSCPRKYRFSRRTGLVQATVTPVAATAVSSQASLPLAVNLADRPASSEPITLDTPDNESTLSTDARRLGSLFHRVCELHISTPTLSADALVTAAIRSSDGQGTPTEQTLLTELTVRFLASSLAYPTTHVATERTMTWEWDRPAARVRLTGVVDRFDGTTITDYKTDMELNGLADKHGDQLRLYGLALSDGDPRRMPALQLYHARSGTLVSVDASPAAVAATLAALDAALVEMAADIYPPRPSFAACQFCPARPLCPEAFPLPVGQ